MKSSGLLRMMTQWCNQNIFCFSKANFWKCLHLLQQVWEPDPHHICTWFLCQSYCHSLVGSIWEYSLARLSFTLGFNLYSGPWWKRTVDAKNNCPIFESWLHPVLKIDMFASKEKISNFGASCRGWNTWREGERSKHKLMIRNLC